MLARFVLVLLLGVLFVAAPARAADEAPLALRVNRAIDRGADYLVAKQEADGSWGANDEKHPLGRTALCTYTLLHAGRGEDDPAVAKALRFLGIGDGYSKPIDAKSTYEAGCLLLLLNALGEKHKANIHRLCQWLVDNFNAPKGMWGYPNGDPDLSNTQYAVLGLEVGRRYGFETPDRIWERLIHRTLELQSPTGGYRYRGAYVYGATMTHAALLVLHFAREALGGKKLARKLAEPMARGHKWYADHFDVEKNPLGNGWRKAHYHYYMYGLERYAVIFGLKEIGGHDWYREGAEVLLSQQMKDGHWGRYLYDTAFAILFLRKAVFSAPSKRARQEGHDQAEVRDNPPTIKKPGDDIAHLLEWLVAGPYLTHAKFEDEMFLTDFLDASKATPAVGKSAGKKKWQAYTSPEDKVDLLVGAGPGVHCVYYAAVWLHAEEDREAYLWLGSDDGVRVYLDGERILDGHHHDHSGFDHYRVPLHLTKGRHALILEVENVGHYCYFHARLTDLELKPLTGVTPSLSKRAPR